jgi:hypothetical protein
MLVYKIVGDSTSMVTALNDSPPPWPNQVFKSFKVERAFVLILNRSALHIDATLLADDAS